MKHEVFALEDTRPATPTELDVIYVTKFDIDVGKDFYTKFRQLEADPKVKVIPIVIQSYGGSVHALFAMLDLIASSTKPVCTVGIGCAMSCGSVLLAAGTPGYRYLGPNSQVMIHEVSAGAGGKVTDMAGSMRNAQLLNDILLKKLAVFCKKKDRNFFHKLLRGKLNVDWYLNGKECKKLGLIDKIGVPRFMKP